MSQANQLSDIVEAVKRLSENEARVDTFTNASSPGYYTTNTTPAKQVETLPHLMDRLKNRYLTIKWLGVWTPNTEYSMNDVVRASGQDSWWICADNFTSSATFQSDVDARNLIPYAQNVIPDDKNQRISWTAAADIPAGAVASIPVTYYPTRHALLVWYQGAVCVPKAADVDAAGVWQYEEVGADPNNPSGEIKFSFDVKAGDLIDVLSMSSAVSRTLEKMEALHTDVSGAMGAVETATTTCVTKAGEAASSATAAAGSATSAADSADSASTSATNATASELGAATSATEAAGSAATASTKAGEASASATAAAGSKVDAQNAASTATTKAGEASVSATNSAWSAGQASTSATSASNSASTATTKASEASASATAAAGSATTASTKAGEASASATAAGTSATNAASSASASGANATTAANAATTATTKATEAATSATNAYNSAYDAGVSAAAAADSAQEAANAATVASDLYTTVSTAFDANARYTSVEKTFVTGTLANFPSEITAGPLFFNVALTADKTVITQNCWKTDAQHLYTRCGVANLSDPQNPVLTWTPWNTVAVPEVVKAVEVVTDPQGEPAGTYLVITMDTSSGDQNFYINMSELVGQVYTAGNNGIGLSSDYKISLKLSANPGGLSIVSDGLKHTLSYGTPVDLVFGNTASEGESAAVSRSDHRHKMPAAPSVPSAGTVVSIQAMDDTGSAGSVGTWSRADHLHGMPGFGAPVELVFGNTAASGTENTVARSDHKHKMPASPSIPAGASTYTTQAMGDAGTAGTGGTWSRADHKHGMPAFGTATADLEAGVDGTAGTANTVARSDHTHKIPAASGGGTVARGRTKFTAAVTANSQVTVGSYKVGSDNLILFYDNVLCEKGDDDQYAEVGSAGATSTLVTVKFAIPVGGVLTWVIIG